MGGGGNDPRREVEVSVGLLMPAPPSMPAGARQLKLPAALLGLRGLNNLGQTCFMNCILQIFLHCPPVVRFFLSDRHNRLACVNRRKNEQQTGERGGADPRPCLACEMDTIFAACYSGVQTPYSPHTFLHAMWCSSEHFAGYDQQDAHEFLVAMLAAIYKSFREPEIAPVTTTSTPSVLESLCVRAPTAGGQPARKAYQDLSAIFAGVLRSEVTCVNCGHISVKMEDFADISLDLTRQYKFGAGGVAEVVRSSELSPGPGNASSGGAAESLTACLRAFTGIEHLRCSERCWCDQCGSLQDSSKQMSIERLPNVLCLQLKRFRQRMERGNQASKVDSFVEFPLHSLNMYKYTSAYISSHKRRKDSAGATNGASASERTSSEPCPAAAEHLYDLFGIALHHGTMQNGHYTAYVRRYASWFHCDDASITPATPTAVRSCKAYLLFYIRKAIC